MRIEADSNGAIVRFCAPDVPDVAVRLEPASGYDRRESVHDTQEGA
jgi:hypothetical protein